MTERDLPLEHPLTSIQQGMLFHHIAGGHPGVDLEQIVAELREELDVAGLQAAWRRVIAHHEALRTEFAWEGLPEPVARVLPHVELAWTDHDWSSVPAAEREERFARWLRDDRQSGVPLAKAPLLRFALFRFGAREQRLVWTFHHLLLDGRSFAQVLREVFTSYDAARAGAPAPALPPQRGFRSHVAHLAERRNAAAEEAFWRGALAGSGGSTLPTLSPRPATTSFAPGEDRGQLRRALSPALTAQLRSLAEQTGASLNNVVQAAFATLLARYAGESEVVLGCIRACRRSSVEGAESIVGTFINTLPLRVRLQPELPLVDWLREVRAQNRALAPFETTPLVDIQRWCLPSGARHLFEAILIYDDRVLDGELRELSSAERERHFVLHERTVFPLTLYAYGEDGLVLQLAWDRTRFADAAMARAMEHLETLLASFAEAPRAPLAEQRLMSERERAELLAAGRSTACAWPHEQTIPDQFEEQARKTPEAVALVCGAQSLRYRELEARANQLAWHLRVLGVTTGTIVGLCVPRGIPMVVALLAIQKAGGAYLPLDPEYPSERLSYQVEDAQAPVLVTLGDTSSLFPTFRGAVVRLDEDASRIAVQPASAPVRHLASKDLCYVIYTSGSTGKPKGVMLEHGNVLNFFTGMDQRLGRRDGGAWLAVTSLSFDISVLEICWTLTRGLKVVLYTGDDRRASGKGGLRRKLDFSLFYFASDEAEKAHDKYRLLMEGARRADAFGFEAVWSPERHFHAFGGLYPNPAVASAALASITKRIQIRAGSVVLPLNDPLRVAEEWALVDNLSQGRVGIAFASGWQPNDFVLAPQNYADRKQILMDGIETVRALWRGESIERPLADGRKISVRTLPRPVQKELPVWLTTAGNVDTWIAAGKIGANVLTHLLGQTVEELREKVEAYRRAWNEAGHGPREGRVTIMLHAFVGDCDHSVRELVRKPMIEYLRSSVGLVKSFVASFPTFKTNSAGEAEQMSQDFEKLSAEDLEAILENAFERYFETSGLFGTLETCERMVERLESVGIDEIACLIDFGVDSELALEHIDHLNRLREHVTQRAEAAQGQSIPELIAAHGITHLQCTPSMAAMILAQPGAPEALSKLELLMIGGEAFPPALARELRAHVRGRIVNMYGPTETAIWSSTYEVRGDEEQIPIGEPIANTFFLVLDAHGQPVPSGLSGELWIGGTGVARGYLHRAELTAERFVAHPLAAELGAPRLYRTGDIARRRDDGRFEFLGRVDQQVKLRGYRIELGEIEAALRARAGVHEAAVVVRKDASGEPRLLAYVSPKPGAVLAPDALRLELRESLPEFMIPARVMALPELPHTPNQKIDRKALPDPEQLAAPKVASNTKLEDDLERAIAAIWAEVLTLPSVGRDDNFFDLGGHSLLTVQVQGRLKRQLSVHASITDLFRFPTVRSLADFLRKSGDPAASATTVSAERVQARQEGLDRRRALLQRRQPGRS